LLATSVGYFIKLRCETMSVMSSRY